LALAENGRIKIFISEETLAEIKDVLDRPEVRSQFADLNDEIVGAFVERLRKIGTFLDQVSQEFTYPRDPTDEPYINLAIAAEADYVITRDNDLLELMTGHSAECKEFRQRFRTIQVLTPENLLKEVFT